MEDKKLLVVEHRHVLKYKKAFCLDPEEWVVVSWGRALLGRRFSHAVLIWPETTSKMIAECNVGYCDFVRTKLRPGAEFILIR